MSVDKDLVSVQQARDLVEAAHRAQAQVAEFEAVSDTINQFHDGPRI